MVARAAAENLVPCILELGGKSPTIVDEDADIENAAKRIALGKFANCGQTCVAPDFIMVHKSKLDEFSAKLQESIKSFYGSKANDSSDYSRIINEFHTERLINHIADAKKKGANIIFGGESDKT